MAESTDYPMLYLTGSGGTRSLNQADHTATNGPHMPSFFHIGTTAPTSPGSGWLWHYEGAGTDGSELYSYDETRANWLSVRTVDVAFTAPPWFCQSYRGYLWCPTIPTAGSSTVTIGERTYSFVTTPSAADEVAVGASASEAMRNLAWAINQPIWDPEGAPNQWADDFYYNTTAPNYDVHAMAFAAGTESDQEAFLLVWDRNPMGGGYATATIQFDSIPTDAETVTIESRTYSFYDTGTLGTGNNRVLADSTGTTTDVAENLTTAINLGALSTAENYNNGLGGLNQWVRAQRSSNVVTITARIPGGAGNNLGLSATGGWDTLSGSTLSGGGGLAVSVASMPAGVDWQNTPGVLRASDGPAATITQLTNNYNSLYPGEFLWMDGVNPCGWDHGWFNGQSGDSSTDDTYVAVGWSYNAPMAIGPSTTGASTISMTLAHNAQFATGATLSVPHTPVGLNQVRRYRNKLNEVGATSGESWSMRANFAEDGGGAWAPSTVGIPAGASVHVQFKKTVS